MPLSNSMQAYAAFKLLKDLATPFTEWDAYKEGVIDADGNTISKPKTSSQKKSFGKLTVIARNIKRILAQMPWGKTNLASIATALVLLKEDEEFVAEIINELGIENDLSECNINSGIYYYDKSIFEDTGINASGVAKIDNRQSNINGIVLYEAKDLISGELFKISPALLEK